MTVEPYEWIERRFRVVVHLPDAAGRWLCDVTMPARFAPKEIGADYVLGVARDDDNVEAVVMYRLLGGR